jgi:hypothetical protein
MKRALTRYKRRFNTRAWSNDELHRLAPWFRPGCRVINVSGWLDKDKDGGVYADYFPKEKVYHVANYRHDKHRSSPDSDLFLDLSEPVPDALRGAYDVAFSHTVLEHVPDPAFSFRQIAALTTDLIVTVVPWKQKLHFSPGNYGDYFRMSPFVMRRWHEEAGFTVLWESYTPPPALDTYLFYFATRQRERYPTFPRKLPDIASLQAVVGAVSDRALFENIVHWALRRMRLA